MYMNWRGGCANGRLSINIGKRQNYVAIITKPDFDLYFKENYASALKILSSISRLISRRMSVATSQMVGLQAQYISGRTRTEHDLLGDREVPYEFYYGVQTLRGLENFNITGIALNHYPNLIKALAQVKSAAAKANYKFHRFIYLGLLPMHVMKLLTANTMFILLLI
ncbi:hypothetical protein MASR1M45_23540 [Candidatus Kapaibacterium sp.]